MKTLPTVVLIHAGECAGEFVFYDLHAGHTVVLGDKLAVVLRRVLREEEPINRIRYIVEIVRSKHHDADKRSKVPGSALAMAVLTVPLGNGTELCSRVWELDAFGRLYTLGVQYYETYSTSDPIMTINGLLWDNRILHVKDIVQ